MAAAIAGRAKRATREKYIVKCVERVCVNKSLQDGETGSAEECGRRTRGLYTILTQCFCPFLYFEARPFSA